MKKTFTLLALLIIGLYTQAQCTGDRYRKQVFLDVTTTSDIVYGSNVNLQGNTESLKLDVHEPTGDTETNRPLLIMVHGGNFIGGSKTGADVLPLCESFAKMGYVTASIDYRVGFNGFPIPGPDSVDATETVVRVVHDIRAAIRYFKMDYSENGNTYGIDTSKIVIGGVSAGAIAVVHTAYLDDINEMPSYIDTTQAGLGGGVEGNSGNPNYTSTGILGVINIAGAIRDTSWMTPGSMPLLSFHGDADQTVPYDSDIIWLLGQVQIMRVDGSASMETRANNVGITNCLYTHPGQGHTPHVGNAAYTDTTESVMRNFLVHLVCGDPLDCSYTGSIVSIDEENIIGLSVYPNPAKDIISFEIENGSIEEVRLVNVLGELIYSQKGSLGLIHRINSRDIPKGMYVAEIKSNTGTTTAKILFE